MVYIRHLSWDAWNVDHIARHEVTPEEVESVCSSMPHTSITYGSRVRLIGMTGTGRVLTVILAPEGDGIYYCITARPSSREERRIHESITQGGAS